MISIVVPIYNIESYLEECVESVLRQTYRDWELILVDDGSPDNCPAICDEYAQKDSRIKVVHKLNGGLVSARKAGLEVASGAYVMPLDGDDYLDDRCLETIAHYIERESPDVICFGYNEFSEGVVIPNPIVVKRYGVYQRDDLEREIFPAFIHGLDERHFPHNQCAKVFEKSIYTKYQEAVSSKISNGEDGACTYPLIFNSKKIVILQECLYYYRMVVSSMSKAKKPLSWDNYDLVYKLYEEEIDLSQFGMWQQYYRARTHNLFNVVLSQFYSDKNYSAVVEGINSRFAAHPEYDDAINNSRFSSLSMKVCRLVLKNKWYSVLYFISKNKNFFKRVALK